VIPVRELARFAHLAEMDWYFTIKSISSQPMKMRAITTQAIRETDRNN